MTSTSPVAIVEQLYDGYLRAHDQLAAGTLPSTIPELAAVTARLDEETVFAFQSPPIELHGRDAIERFMVDLRRAFGLRERPERTLQHGNLVISLNRTTMDGSDEEDLVVAVFQLDGERITRFWGFPATARP